MTARRPVAVALASTVAGAGAALVGAGRSWTRAEVAAAPGLPVVVVERTGGALAPGVVALALASLAGVLAVLATRGWARLVVGAVLAAAGTGIAAMALSTALRLPDAAVDVTPWPYVTAAGGALAAAGGAAIAARGRAWGGVGRRFSAPRRARAAHGTPAAHGTWHPADLWAAQDRGEDLTR